MKHHYGDDVPMRQARFSIRSPFAVMVLAPCQLPLMLVLGALSIVFTIWPDVLQHSPISFETRGVLHHVWHYSLLAGSMLALVGMFSTRAYRLRVELSGLSILLGAMTMNLIALVAAVSSAGRVGDVVETSGLDLALRFGILVGLASRAFVIVTAPVVTVKAPAAVSVNADTEG